MKKTRKIAALLLALVLMLSLSACGSFETKMARAAQKMSKLESMRMDMDMDMTIGMSLFGESLDLDGKMTTKADIFTDPLKMRVRTSVEALDSAEESLSYMEKDGDDYTLYVSPDGGESWVSRTVDGEDLPAPAATKEQIALLLKWGASFEESEKETIRGSEATVYSGFIPGEDVAAAIEASGALDALAEVLEMDLGEADFSGLGDIPATIALDDRSGMVVRYTMDLTDVMGSVMDKLLDQLLQAISEEAGLGELDLKGLGLEISIGEVFVNAELYDFDSVEPFEMPKP